ncbi:MAG TPA: GntR family transcriptional regulator [Caldimonas sp.]|nr:GntR family transcriptional regulator [Caldimonas sp.]
MVAASSSQARPHAKVSAVDRASERLRELIARGRLVGGQPLIESELGQQLEVARPTLRECIRRLETQGLLVSRKRGLQLRLLTRSDVEDLFSLRMILEVYAAGRAAARMGEAPSAARAALLAELRYWRSKAAGDAGAFSERNRRFHDLVVELAGNVHLPRMLDQTLMLLFASQFRSFLPPSSVARAASQHVEILEAIERQDPKAAEVAMRRHVTDARRALRSLPEDAFGNG